LTGIGKWDVDLPRERFVQAIDLETFICNMEAQFDGRLSLRLQSSTRFRDLPEWSSLQALIVVAGFERTYGVTISSKDLHRAETVEDLYRLVVRRKGA
jgi:acyl carrier protein